MKKIIALFCIIAIAAISTIVVGTGEVQIFEQATLKTPDLSDLQVILIGDDLEMPIGPILETPPSRYYIQSEDTPIFTKQVDLSGSMVIIPYNIGSPNIPDVPIVID